MKRLIVKLCLFLLLGAIINVAVAWACCLWSRTGPAEDLPTRLCVQHDGDRESWMTVRIECGMGIALVDLVYHRSAPIEVTFGFNASMPWDNDEIHAGWPMHSIKRSSHMFEEFGSTSWRCGIPIPAWLTKISARWETRLPIEAIWPGFAINTIFYAAIFWMMFSAPGNLRRALRRRRGQCTACGYSIAPGTGQVCSECGSPLSTP